MIKNAKDVARYLNDEKAAGELIQKLRWPDAVACPFCDGIGKKGGDKPVYECSAPNAERKQWKCGACRKKFSVTSRSIFEGSHIKLGMWIYAIHKMCTSKKGISAKQLQRELGIHYRSAWFLCHRVREAMALEPMVSMLGAGPDAVVEIDETYVGGKEGKNLHKGRKTKAKAIVMTIIDREAGVKSVHVPNTKKGTLQALAKPIVDRSANIVTDAHLSYTGLDKHFHSHHVVDHSETFVRGIIFHTNFAESYHSLLKRGIIGSFHHISDKHLHRYLSEFDFRWNTRKEPDGERTLTAIKAAPGRRLTYKVGPNSLIARKN